MSHKATIAELNAQRRQAVQLRLDGQTVTDTATRTRLSGPTISAALKAYRDGGWEAVDVKPRGRPATDAKKLTGSDAERQILLDALIDEQQDQTLWTTPAVRDLIQQKLQIDVSVQTVANYVQHWQLAASDRRKNCLSSTSIDVIDWLETEYNAFLVQARKRNATVLWLGSRSVDDAYTQLYAHTLRGRCLWRLLKRPARTTDYQQFLQALALEYPKSFALVLPGKHLLKIDMTTTVSHAREQDIMQIVAPEMQTPLANQAPVRSKMASTNNSVNQAIQQKPIQTGNMPGYLDLLEAESIHILREVVAEADKPAMLHSMGKDSAVMLHLARKAFYPAPLPFPILHIDTTWNFHAANELRDQIGQDPNIELITTSNQEGIDKGVNPFTHGVALHTEIMKTDALKSALDTHSIDIAIGGARRDEEQSRSKERVFSFRSDRHRWDPRAQRPELWNLYNTRKKPDESIRVFPLSNWSELDIWQYIRAQGIQVLPLYFAAERPVVVRDGRLIMVDDERMPLQDGEMPTMRSVRFRSLGCYPLTGAIESAASTPSNVIQEILLSKHSERYGRVIDHDPSATMEVKKQQGYF